MSNVATLSNVEPIHILPSSMTDEHREMLSKLAHLKVPEDVWPNDQDWFRAIPLKQRIGYLRLLFDATNAMADHIADEFADNAGARREDIDMLEGAQTDFLAPFTAAIERMEQ